MVSSRADPSEPLSTPSRPSSRAPRPSFPIPTSICVVAVLLASQLAICAADSSNDDLGSVTWTFPRGGEVFHHLDTVNVTYQSSYAEPWLYIWCYENQTANTVRFIRKRQVEPRDASVLMYMDFSTSTPCWFNLRDNTKSNRGRNTEKWSLKQAERESGPITTGAALPSSTATSTAATTTRPSSSTAAGASTTTAAITNAEASSSSSSNSSSNGGDISPGAKAGLGIGVGIATSLLCAGAFWLYYRHVKRKEHHQEVYRRIVGSGQGGGGAGPSHHDTYATPNNSEHLEPWRYGGTPQPAPSAWSGVSDPSTTTTDWYAGGGHQATTTGANAPYQYYDPVGSSHQLGAMAGAAGMGAAGAGATYHHYSHSQHHYSSQPSVTTTASMTAEPPPSTRGHGPIVSNPPSHVPEAAAIRDVQDLSSSLFPSEYNEPVSPVSASAAGGEDGSIPPARVASVNYGPNGPRDASTGADFTLLPDYTAPPGPGREDEEEEDIYGPPTPRSPPPPHSAHAHIVAGGQQQRGATREQQHAWQPAGGHTTAGVVELPTAQTHHRGYGPQAAELPAGDFAGAQQPPMLRQQRSDLRGPEQKVLLQDVATLRRAGWQGRDGG